MVFWDFPYILSLDLRRVQNSKVCLLPNTLLFAVHWKPPNFIGPHWNLWNNFHVCNLVHYWKPSFLLWKTFVAQDQYLWILFNPPPSLTSVLIQCKKTPNYYCLPSPRSSLKDQLSTFVPWPSAHKWVQGRLPLKQQPSEEFPSRLVESVAQNKVSPNPLQT